MNITTATQITILRIFLTPAIMYGIAMQQWLCVVALFCLAMLTDFADGFVARRYQQESKLGQLLDPVADKFLILGSFFSLLSFFDDFFIYVAIIFLIIKEIVLLAGAAALHYQYGLFIKPSWLSRIASVSEMVLFIFFVGMHASDSYLPIQVVYLILTAVCFLSVALLWRYGLYIKNLRRK